MAQGTDPEISEVLRRRLEGLAVQARGRSARLAEQLAARQGLPPEPGDIFVMALTADLPVEWVILERRSEAPAKLLAVPADTNPLAGTADLAVPAGASGGPLSLRCRFGIWLDAALFDPGLRSGALTPEVVAAALQRFRQVESGGGPRSPLAEEVDVDPEYVDWVREVPGRARARVTAAAREVTRSAGTSWGVAHRLAAGFALLVVGLSIWVALLKREVDRLSVPSFNVPSAEVVLGPTSRGETVVSVPQEASHVFLVLVPDPALGLREGYLEITDPFGKPVVRPSRIRLSPTGELRLLVPRKLLPDGRYLVRVYSSSGFPAHASAAEFLRVKSAE